MSSQRLHSNVSEENTKLISPIEYLGSGRAAGPGNPPFNSKIFTRVPHSRARSDLEWGFSSGVGTRPVAAGPHISWPISAFFWQMWGFCQKLKSQFPATIKLMAKRSIFDELMEAVAAMRAHREGKARCARTRSSRQESAKLIRNCPETLGRWPPYPVAYNCLLLAIVGLSPKAEIAIQPSSVPPCGPPWRDGGAEGPAFVSADAPPLLPSCFSGLRPIRANPRLPLLLPLYFALVLSAPPA